MGTTTREHAGCMFVVREILGCETSFVNIKEEETSFFKFYDKGAKRLSNYDWGGGEGEAKRLSNNIHRVQNVFPSYDHGGGTSFLP